MNFNEHGNLNGGIIRGLSMQDVESFFVRDFSTSQTRARNFAGFQQFLSILSTIGVKQRLSKLWLDGSFLTNKIDPNDIDLVFYFNPEPNDIPYILQFLQNEAKKIHTIGVQYYCDAYFCIDHTLIPSNEIDAKRHFEYETKYWMGQFGFNRDARNKGIIELIL
ncbi:DUF6932 family protein [Neobacillus novalis]|nr:hypothetical protein [Neobacillus novalis]